MTKIITCSELRHRTLAELEALFRTLQIELGCTALAHLDATPGEFILPYDRVRTAADPDPAPL